MSDIPVLPESVDNALKNVSDKPTAAMGQTIAELWQLVLGGRVSLAAEKQRLRYAQALEEYRKSLEEKVDNTPEDKQVEPSIQIAAQALEDSQYCIGAEELREMFANLISRSMHADYAAKIHPSFSKIAQQLSPTDAQMLHILHMPRSSQGIAVVNYIAKNPKADAGFLLLMNNVPAVKPAGCSPEDAAYSIASLIRLGLIEIPGDLFFVDDAYYSGFSQTDLYRRLHDEASAAGRTLDTQKHVMRLTAIGKDFVRVCLD